MTNLATKFDFVVQFESSLKFQLTKFSVIIMTLNQKYLDILKAIQKGCQSDTQISKYLGFDIALVGHYLDEMKKEGYVEFNDIELLGVGEIKHRDFPRLTDKGKVAINNPEALINKETTTMNNINNFYAPIHAPIGVLQNSDGNTVNITQNNNQNIQEIINSLEFLEKEIQVFPKEEKEEALVCLSDLKEEIKGSQNPIKIRILLRSFLAVALPLISLIVNGADFANNMTDLTTKYNVPMPQISLPFK